MSKELKSTAEANQKAILALSRLSEERLKCCAIELQVDLEMFDFDHGKEIEGPLSPEEFFEAFAAHEKFGLAILS
jgi:hypothetical protein